MNNELNIKLLKIGFVANVKWREELAFACCIKYYNTVLGQSSTMFFTYC